MLINNDPPERLKAFGLHAFETLSRFARALDMSPQGLNPYVKSGGRVIQNDKHRKKLEQLGLNLDWYDTGEGEMYNDKKGTNGIFDNINIQSNVRSGDEATMNEVFAKPKRTIKQLPFPVGTGVSSPTNIQPIEVPLDMEAPQDALSFYFVGDSMNESIPNGFFVIIDTTLEMEVGKIALFVVKDTHIVATIKEISENLIVVSFENPKYENISLKKGEYKYEGLLHTAYRRFK